MDWLEEIRKKERVLPRILEQQAHRWGDKPLIIYEEESYSYRQVNETANRIGNTLLLMGVKKGDHVLIMMPNCPEGIIFWMGLSKIGAVEVPLNPAYKGHILRDVINSSRAEWILIDRNFRQSLESIWNDLKYLKKMILYDARSERSLDLMGRDEIHPFELLYQGSPEPPSIVVNGWDPMALMFTSGTTGCSKGVIVSYWMAYSYAGIEFNPNVDHRDIYYLMLPLFHSGGQWGGFLPTLVRGGTVVVARHFSVTNFWSEVRKYGCTTTLLLSTMSSYLWKQPEQPDDADNPLRWIQMTPVIPVLKDFEKRFNLKIGTGYGLTEGSGPITIHEVQDHRSCGRLRPDFEAQIVDENDCPVPDGNLGELCLRSKLPHTLMSGYYGFPEETLKVTRNLWLHTGDCFWRDKEGNYFFADRLGDVIRRKGENICSAEVEREVMEHEAVLQCAAVAVPSEDMEDEIKVCYVVKPGMKLEPIDLIKFLCPRLPKFMVPRYLEPLPELPMTSSGKIRKDLLRVSTDRLSLWDGQTVIKNLQNLKTV